MTILEALQWGANKLKKAGGDSPMLDAELLLAAILEVPKSWLFGHMNEELKPHLEERFSLFLDRRARHEPIAYIIGKKDFYGRSFTVSPSVLIPRPATETLIDLAKTQYQLSEPETTLIVDVGTGSGAIAITLAAETGCAHIIAIEPSERAREVAKRNITAHNLESTISLQAGVYIEPLVHIFNTIHQSGNPSISSVYPFKDLILCANLPYLTLEQMTHLDPDVRFEPSEALVSGADGLQDYFHLLKQLKRDRAILPRYVHVFLEIDPTQTEAIQALILHQFPEASIRVEKDLQQNNRIVCIDL